LNDDDEIKRILCDILCMGLLRIRAFGNAGYAEVCSVEADHLHNLPRLIQSVHWEELIYYYTVERAAFLENTRTNVEAFMPLWSELDKAIQAKRAEK
jgi:hypothetical protein